MAVEQGELFARVLLYAAQAGYTEEIIPAATVCKATLNDGNLWAHLLRFQASPPRFDKPGSRRCWSMRTALMAACKTGNTDRVVFLLRSCLPVAAASHRAGAAIVNWKDAEGKSALHRAIDESHERCVRELLVSGLVDLELKDRVGKSALHVATFNGHIDIAKLLLAHTPKPDVTTKDHSGHGLLSEDAFYSKVPAESKDEIAILLLQNGIFPPKDFCRRALNEGGPGEAVCLELIERGFITADFIRDDYSLVPGGNPYEHLDRPRDEDWPLLCAISNGLSDTVILRLLDCESVRFNMGGQFGDRALHRSPLHALCEKNGSLAVMKRMFERGAGSIINARMGWGQTALHTAADHCDEEISHFLLAQGADATISDGARELPFYAAASKGREELALLLLDAATQSTDRSSTFDITDYLANEDYFDHPLLIAAEQGLGRLVERLLDLGADQTIRRSHTKRTALSEACRQGHIETARLLLSRLSPGADLDMNVPEGRGYRLDAEYYWLRRPLTYACQWPGKSGIGEVVKGLIERGAEVSPEPEEGEGEDYEGPLHVLISAKNGSEEQKLALLEILLSADGVDVDASGRNGKSLVYLAATRGYSTIVRRLQEAGADLDQPSREEWSPLQRAVKKGFFDTVKVLVECGADIDYEPELVFNCNTDDDGSDDEEDENIYDPRPHSALSLAVYSSAEAAEQIALYLVENGADVEARYTTTEILRLACLNGLDSVVVAALEASIKQSGKEKVSRYSFELIMCAAQAKNQKLALRMIEMGLEPPQPDDDADEDDVGWLQNLVEGCLFDACKNGLLELVKATVTRWKVNVDEEFIDRRKDVIMTSLHAASAGGHVDVLAFLLDSGADLFARDSDGRTAFFVALEESQSDVVEFFLARADDARVFNQEDSSGKRPLFCACMGNRIDILRLLLADTRVERDIVAPPGHDDDDRCNPLLIQACSCCPEEVVLVLLEAGFDPHIRGDKNTQAIHLAAKRGLVKVLEKLLSLGVKPNCRDYRGRTPLFYAASQGRLEAMRFLLALDKSLVDGRTSDGRTILMAAAEGGHTDAVLLLLEDYKLPTGATTLRGETALMLAIQNKHPTTALTLIDGSTTEELNFSHRLTREGPLQMSLRQSLWEVCLELLEKGCDATQRAEGKWALEVAFEHAPVYSPDGNTDLEAHEMFREVIAEFILNGADPSTSTNGYVKKDTSTALDVALVWANSDKGCRIVDMLLREGGDFKIRSSCLRRCLNAVTPKTQLALKLLEPDVLPHMRSTDGKEFDLEEDADGQSFLYLAARQNLLSVVMRLLELGADPFKPCTSVGWAGANALHEAARVGNAEVVRAFLASPKTTRANINAIYRNESTALTFASASGTGDAAIALIEDPRVDLTWYSASASLGRTTPLETACAYHNNLVVRRLCEKRLTAGVLSRALTCAIVTLNLEAVRLLAGLRNVDLAQSLFVLLAREHDWLRWGREKNADDRLPMLSLLLSLGAPVNSDAWLEGTAVHLAVKAGSFGAVLRLLEAGANPNIPLTIERTTPLMSAAHAGLDDMVSLLCKHGADVNAQDRNGLTALAYCCKGLPAEVATHQRVKIARMLLAAGARPAAGPGPATTELHLACAGFNLLFGDELIAVLLAAGSSPLIRTAEGKLPIDELPSTCKDRPLWKKACKLLEDAAASAKLKSMDGAATASVARA
jgi:uncharacterized protein